MDRIQCKIASNNQNSGVQEQLKLEDVTRSCLSGVPDNFYPGNWISTSKYTWYNFLPKNLIEQFSKMANIYFLTIAVLQTISVISISDGFPSILIPLTFIVLVTALKDVFEDYKRKKSDQQENTKITRRFRNGKLEDCNWEELLVGDIVKVKKFEYIPADLLILGTSEPKGVCYIETKNLDGETNMKQKNASKEIYDYLGHDDNFNSQKVSFQYEGPNQHLYQFQGTCYLDERIYNQLREKEILLNQINKILRSRRIQHQDKLDELSKINYKLQKFQCKMVAISNQNFLLRGCSLQNTKHIYGLVTYTGHDTKIMRNSFKARAKKSQLEKEMGFQILQIFLAQIFICFFAAIFYTVWYSQNSSHLPYLSIDRSSIVDNSATFNLFVRLGNWVLMFGNFVPISLLVTLEMVKFIQGLIISNDDKYMTSRAYGQISPCVVQSSNLNEELGQIQYIFSDKTGTLTCNQMEFKKICINGISYGEIGPDSSQFLHNISSFPQVTNVDFKDGNLIKIINDPSHPQYINVFNALLLLSLCHSVILETQQENRQFVYNASSPDELALVNFARFVGFEYQGIDQENVISIKTRDKILKFKLFHILEFDSTRKRNSVIIKDIQTQKYMILTKGADSIIFDRMNKRTTDATILDKYNFRLKEYGKIGLRTLLLAQRELTEIEFMAWNKKYHEASILMNGREEAKGLLQDQIETNFDIIGATAIEDKLQDQVGETIQAIRNSGIKIWVLTGDKVETAINIGYSCQLISPTMKLIIIEIIDQDKLEEQLLYELQNLENNIARQALVLTGDTLTIIFNQQNQNLQRLMISIAIKCVSVLCCRVSPSQKQQIVSIIRNYHPKSATLAIGDGANDVSMITAAHVGIGIKGVEGQQASRASDYAIGEFKMLRPLLFIYGRESYRKNSTLVLYNFFKNVAIVFPQFWLSMYNSFSGQSPYETIMYQLYNILYTSAPIIVFSVFDEEYLPETLYKNTNNLYQIGPKRMCFSSKLYWKWFINATLQSTIVAFFIIYSFEEQSVNSQGLHFDLYWTGTAVYGMAVVIANFKMATLANSWNIAFAFFFLGGMIVYLITLISLGVQTKSNIYSIVQIFFTTPNFYLSIILIIITTIGLDYGLSKLLSSKIKYLDQQENLENKYLGTLSSRTQVKPHIDYEISNLN